ncbi:LCP family protein [Candidatus Saccharibacteria bacterium]|nr:LCP family protein [Candidatus Saccharibacteria bacterium]
MNNKSNQTSTNWILSSLKIALVVAQAATSTMLIFSLINTGIIGGWVLALIVVALMALLALSVVELIIHKRASMTAQIICAVISVACIVISCFAMSFTGAFNGFLDKVTEKRIETKAYSVAVEEDSDYHEIEDLKQKNIGFLSTDTKAGNAEQVLQNEITFRASYYDDLSVLLEVLKNDLSDAIVLEADRIEALKEADEKLSEEIRIIYTFEVELNDKDVEVSKKAVTEEPFIVYISGSDSREGIKATARSDVNIVVAVNPKDAKILLVSIPRDTYVQLHDTTGIKDKLTHAGVYGIEMSKTTIEDFLGIDIDYTIKVSFDTVVRVVDELDGIDINSDTAMRLSAMNRKTCDFVVGVQHVDGDCALRFARERKTYQTGDRHRGENQQEVITAIINKLSSSRDYILKLPAILDIAADSFETSLTREEITDFIRLQLQEQPKWQVKSIAVNGTGTMLPTYSMGANLPLYVMIPDETTVEEARTQINTYLGKKINATEKVEENQE